MGAGPATISGSTFHKNSANSAGKTAAVTKTDATVTITGSTFLLNTASGLINSIQPIDVGGASANITINGISAMAVINNTIVYNTANNGGGIGDGRAAVPGSSGAVSTHVVNSTIAYNDDVHPTGNNVWNFEANEMQVENTIIAAHYQGTSSYPPFIQGQTHLGFILQTMSDNYTENITVYHLHIHPTNLP